MRAHTGTKQTARLALYKIENMEILKLRYKLALIAVITLFTTSCSIITNVHELSGSQNNDWKAVGTGTNYRYYLFDNNYIGVYTPMLYEEVVSIGPLVFPIIPVFFYDQQVIEPYIIDVTTSWDGKELNTNDILIDINDSKYNYTLSSDRRVLYINMPSSSIEDLKFTIPQFNYKGRLISVPSLIIKSKSKFKFTTGP